MELIYIAHGAVGFIVALAISVFKFPKSWDAFDVSMVFVAIMGFWPIVVAVGLCAVFGTLIKKLVDSTRSMVEKNWS